jgi:hypothetical protein
VQYCGTFAMQVANCLLLLLVLHEASICLVDRDSANDQSLPGVYVPVGKVSGRSLLFFISRMCSGDRAFVLSINNNASYLLNKSVGT